MNDERVPTLTVPIPSRESVQSKAIRILLDRRLTILGVRNDRVWAEVRGTTDRVYHPCYTHGRWSCDCDNRSNRCSHLVALQYVTVRPEE